jgi:solute carrier family 25 folate transporter 32
MDVLRQIWKYEGMYGFYKGILPNLLRVTPACCITFLVYEKIISLSHKSKRETIEVKKS